MSSDFSLLEKRARTGINWFYWIAALSLINTVLTLSGTELNLVIGLGVTQFVDAIMAAIARDAGGMSMMVKAVGVFMSALASAVFALFAYLGNQRRLLWAVIVGMVLYGLDGLLFLVTQDWLSLGFHGLALFGLFGGLRAARDLRAMREDVASAEA